MDSHGLSWNRVIIIASLAGLILAVSLNIYVVVVNAFQNYEVLQTERAKLAELQSKNAQLESELAYYSSLEYKQRYGYDSLNLARPGEQIYLVQEADRESFELEEENPDPIQTEDNQRWWQLFFESMLESPS